MHNIGKFGVVRVGGLNVEIKIEDYRKSFGHDQWQVTPVSGSDSVWISEVYVDGQLLK